MAGSRAAAGPFADMLRGELAKAGPDEAFPVLGVAAYVGAKAAQQPTLIVLEDLHWSDENSLDLVHDLARRAPAIVTSAPSRPKATATARPMPLSAPVMRANLSQSLPLPRRPAPS